MSNPWKNIPLQDYEGHMALPAIGQAEMLASEFGLLLNDYPAEAAAVIGCAGGNGFEEAARAGVARLVGLDINEHYIAEARRRFLQDIAGLELYCANIEDELPAIGPVDLVFAALVFEYVDVDKALRNIKSLCRSDAVLGALLQLPKHDAAAVSASPYTSLQGLDAIMRLVPPQELRQAAESAGFAFIAERTVTLESGKQFAHLLFRA
jgi:2-polyprenyl-3-methyl-5-hydroxy-6-metoxy-1,4-benzoquinol methylase